jgi:hypothetical protein
MINIEKSFLGGSLKVCLFRDVDEWFGKEREWATSYGGQIRY